MDVHFYTDAEMFLAAAGELIAADPLRYSVIATVAEMARSSEVSDDRPFWFATVGDETGVAGLAMRTLPEPPHAGFVATMPGEAVQALAEALAGRGERVPAWNGDLDAARALCASVADGRPVEVELHTRLFEARTVRAPARPAGALRKAVPADEALVAEGMRGFHHDMETQGGRTPNPDWAPRHDALRRAIDAGLLWLWELDGEPVHLTGAQPEVFGARRVGPVYTPAEHRGHGYAGWVVAHLTQQILDAGVRPCLYTDQANPISNLVYERIGYERLWDEGNVVVRDAPTPGR